jgi:hypothetical protein
MEHLLNLWSNVQTNKETVEKVATLLNEMLPTKDKVSIVRITQAWWMIVGTKGSKERYDEMVEIGKQQLTHSKS